MKVLTATQGTEEWFRERSGRVTASSVADAIAFLKRGDKKGGDTAARAAYKARIVAETLRGEPLMDGFLSTYMQYGTEMEPFARTAYEIKQDTIVETLGFVVHPTIERAGASPDGLVGGDGGLEIKCPKTETHLAHMMAGILPPEYEPQMMFNLACTEREWWDFMSYDARMPERHQQFVIRVHRDEKRIAEIEAGVIQFLAEVDEMIARLEELHPPPLEAQLRGSLDDPSLGVTDADID